MNYFVENLTNEIALGSTRRLMRFYKNGIIDGIMDFWRNQYLLDKKFLGINHKVPIRNYLEHEQFWLFFKAVHDKGLVEKAKRSKRFQKVETKINIIQSQWWIYFQEQRSFSYLKIRPRDSCHLILKLIKTWRSSIERGWLSMCMQKSIKTLL